MRGGHPGKTEKTSGKIGGAVWHGSNQFDQAKRDCGIREYDRKSGLVVIGLGSQVLGIGSGDATHFGSGRFRLLAVKLGLFEAAGGRKSVKSTGMGHDPGSLSLYFSSLMIGFQSSPPTRPFW